MRQILITLGAVIAAVWAVTMPALAHHGGAAFDQTQRITFSGTVTELRFANRHAPLFFPLIVRRANEQYRKWARPVGKIHVGGQLYAVTHRHHHVALDFHRKWRRCTDLRTGTRL